jgi:hypothetical protein
MIAAASLRDSLRLGAAKHTPLSMCRGGFCSPKTWNISCQTISSPWTVVANPSCKINPLPRTHGAFPFIGLIRCGECDGMVTAEEKHFVGINSSRARIDHDCLEAFGEPEPGQKVFIRSRQQREAWEDEASELSKLVPVNLLAAQSWTGVPLVQLPLLKPCRALLPVCLGHGFARPALAGATSVGPAVGGGRGGSFGLGEVRRLARATSEVGAGDLRAATALPWRYKRAGPL